MGDAKKLVLCFSMSVLLSACGGDSSGKASSGPRSVDAWWAEIEKCVSEKETKKKKSKENHIDAWMYNEWEAQCTNDNPYSTDPSVKEYVERMEVLDVADIELDLKLSNHNVFNVTVGRLDVTSLSDYAEIHGLQVNRGNCRSSQSLTADVMRFPVTLGYAQSTTVYLYCKIDTVREVTVATNEGDYTYSFTP